MVDSSWISQTKQILKFLQRNIFPAEKQQQELWLLWGLYASPERKINCMILIHDLISSVGILKSQLLYTNLPQHTQHVEYHMVITAIAPLWFFFFLQNLYIKVSICLCRKIYGYFLSSQAQLLLVTSVVKCKLDHFCWVSSFHSKYWEINYTLLYN